MYNSRLDGEHNDVGFLDISLRFASRDSFSVEMVHFDGVYWHSLKCKYGREAEVCEFCYVVRPCISVNMARCSNGKLQNSRIYSIAGAEDTLPCMHVHQPLNI